MRKHDVFGIMMSSVFALLWSLYDLNRDTGPCTEFNGPGESLKDVIFTAPRIKHPIVSTRGATIVGAEMENCEI